MSSSAVGNVILNISTGKTDFASIKGFVDLMGQAVRMVGDFAKQQDAYVDALQKSTISVDKATQATGNLIESTKLMQATARLSTAGIKLTEEQFRNVAVAAADMGEITGDAAGALDSLVTAMISGNERGLKPYNISLDGANTKAEKQQAIVSQLTKKYGDMSIEADTLTDSTTSLGNALDRLIGSMWSAATKEGSGVLGFFNSLTRQMNSLASVIEKLGTSRGILQWFANVAPGLVNTYGVAFGFGKNLAGRISSQGQKTIDQQNRDSEFVGPPIEGRGSPVSDKRSRGGGGRAGSNQPDMIFTLDEIDRANDDQLLGSYSRSATKWEMKQLDFAGSSLISTEMAAMDAREKAIDRYTEKVDKLADRELGFAENFRKQWQANFDAINLGASTANALFGSVEQSIRMVAEAAINGNKLSVRAFFDMVSGYALNLGVKATLEALYETFQAIRAGVSGSEAEALGHTAAAAQGYAVAATAFAVAAGARSASMSTSPNQSAGLAVQRGAGYTGAIPSMSKQTEESRTEVVVVLEGDAEGVFRVAKKGSRSARANGDTGFAEAS